MSSAAILRQIKKLVSTATSAQCVCMNQSMTFADKDTDRLTDIRPSFYIFICLCAHNNSFCHSFYSWLSPIVSVYFHLQLYFLLSLSSPVAFFHFFFHYSNRVNRTRWKRRWWPFDMCDKWGFLCVCVWNRERGETHNARSLHEGHAGAEGDLWPQWAAVLRTFLHPTVKEMFIFTDIQYLSQYLFTITNISSLTSQINHLLHV